MACHRPILVLFFQLLWPATTKLSVRGIRLLMDGKSVAMFGNKKAGSPFTFGNPAVCSNPTWRQHWGLSPHQTLGFPPHPRRWFGFVVSVESSDSEFFPEFDVLLRTTWCGTPHGIKIMVRLLSSTGNRRTSIHEFAIPTTNEQMDFSFQPR